MGNNLLVMHTYGYSIRSLVRYVSARDSTKDVLAAMTFNSPSCNKTEYLFEPNPQRVFDLIIDQLRYGLAQSQESLHKLTSQGIIKN